MDSYLSIVAMPAIAAIHKYVFRSCRHLFCLFYRHRQRMPVIWIPARRHCARKPPATARHRYAHLTPKFIPLMRLPFTDAFNMRLMHAVNLVLVRPLLLKYPFAYDQKFPNFNIWFGRFSLYVPPRYVFNRRVSRRARCICRAWA
jgi:hypothetical protein